MTRSEEIVQADHYVKLFDEGKLETRLDLLEALNLKWFRLNTLYKIKVKEPVTDKNGRKSFVVRFRPNRAQRIRYASRHNRDLILKARQLGFTTFEMIDALDDCLFTANFNAGCIAHALDDAKSIYRNKIRFAYENIPASWLAILDTLGFVMPVPTSDKSEGYVFSNGSSIHVSTGYRGGTLQRLHVSEFGKICRKYPEKAEEIISGAFEAVPLDGQITIESTAEGREGRFYQYATEAQRALQQGAKLTSLDFRFHFFPWWEEADYTMDPDGVVIDSKKADYFASLEKVIGQALTPGQRAWYVKKESVLKDKMKREYPSTPEESFEQAIEGAYFTTQMALLREKKQIRRVPYDHRLPVYTFWDLGRNDFTAIWFMQYAWGEYRMIRYYENNGENIQFYCRKLREFEYHYSTVYLPHDAAVTDYSNADNMSRRDIVASMGYGVEVVTKCQDKREAIQAARDILPACWFDEENCSVGIAHLDAHRKDWNDSTGNWKDEPFRGPAKHAADALEQMARGFSMVAGGESYEPEVC
jgi:hypothetical protein